jgi:hypothetical protein
VLSANCFGRTIRLMKRKLKLLRRACSTNIAGLKASVMTTG